MSFNTKKSMQIDTGSKFLGILVLIIYSGVQKYELYGCL